MTGASLPDVSEVLGEPDPKNHLSSSEDWDPLNFILCRTNEAKISIDQNWRNLYDSYLRFSSQSPLYFVGQQFTLQLVLR